MSNWRWWLCSLLFVATTVNYLDRQVLSLTYEEFIKPQFHWTDANYGTITSFFSIFYAIACLFAGKFVDWMGTKKGYLIAIGVWSAGACLHAACGWATAAFTGMDSSAALKAVEAGSNAALAISTTSVYLFLLWHTGPRRVRELPGSHQGDSRIFPEERSRLRDFHLQCRCFCRCSRSSSLHPSSRCQIRLGMGIHHNRWTWLHMDVLLGIHV